MIHEFVRMCESVSMAQIVCVLPPAEDRQRLLAVVADRNRPLKHVQRARIVLYSADHLPVQEVARRAGVSRPADWRWQARYAEQGVDGLLRDKTRKPGRAPLSAKVVAKVMDLTCSEPPGHATHWTGRAMAKAVGVSLRAVQRLWQAHRLQPHRIRTFKRSNDPEFAEKVEDIVASTWTRPSTRWSSRSTRRDPMGADSDRRSGRVRLSNHPPWRRPCELQLTDPKLRPLSEPILVRFSCRWN